MLWQIIVLLVLVWMAVLRWKKWKMVKLAKQLKSKYTALPIIGHAHMFLGSDEDRMESLKNLGTEALRLGGSVSFWLGNHLFIMVADPEVAGPVLKTCLEKDDTVLLLRNVVGNGSLFAPVSIWRPRRKVLAPTFSAKRLRYFVEIFSRQSSIMVKQLQNAAGKGTFSLWKYMTSYTMDSVCETTLGIRMNVQKMPDQPFVTAFEHTCQVDAQRVLQPWLHNDTIFRMMPGHKEYIENAFYIRNFVDEIITSKKQDLQINNIDQPKHNTDHNEGLKSLLELLIEASAEGKGYNHLGMVDETSVILLAGTDTSAVGASLTTLMLAKHPEIQDKVFNELQEVFGDSERQLEAKDLPRLKYLEAVIKETMRLYPPVPFIVRKVEKDFPLRSGLTIVAGCGVFINIWSLHRNPKYWGEDAEEFRPERFLDSSLQHPAAFMPFSHGPRNCLGSQYAMLSMKTALAALLRQYRVLPANGHQVPKYNALRVKFGLILKHVDNFDVELQSRR